MLHVLLLILKIIGIIIAVLLGLVLLTVVTVLFVPIQYFVKAQYYDGVPIAQAKVTWLLHLLRVKFLFNPDEGFQIRIKILFFGLKSSKKDTDNKKSKKKKNTKKQLKKKEHFVFDEEEFISEDDDIFFDKPEEQVNIATMEEHFVQKDYSDIKADEVDAENEENIFETGVFKTDIKEKEKTKKHIILIIKNKIIGIIQRIRDFIQQIKITKENATQKVKTFSDMVNDPKNREMVSFLWMQLKKLLKILKPKKVKAYIHFGLKDAEATGKAAMYAAAFYGIIGKNVTIYPDFEQEILEGNVCIKGSIRLFPIGIIALKIYRNKQVRKYIKK